MTEVLKWQFSQEEIRAKLEELGYYNLPDEALMEFSKDLHQMIAEENQDRNVQDETSSSLISSTLSSPTMSYENSTCSPGLDDRKYHTSRTEHLVHVPQKHRQRTINNMDLHEQAVSYRLPQNYQPLPVNEIVPRRTTKQYVIPEKENAEVDTSIRLAQKRKVLRHKNGIAKVFDESFRNDSSDISLMEEKLQQLPLKDRTEDNVSVCSDQSHESAAWSSGRNKNALPSFIRSKSTSLSSCGVRKTDPVNRYHQFNQEWRSKKVPGEKVHKNLRWSTREQMLQYETFERPRHNYIPNNYVAPTEKKRQALRWKVRSTLANQ